MDPANHRIMGARTLLFAGGTQHRVLRRASESVRRVRDSSGGAHDSPKNHGIRHGFLDIWLRRSASSTMHHPTSDTKLEIEE